MHRCVLKETSCSFSGPLFYFGLLLEQVCMLLYSKNTPFFLKFFYRPVSLRPPSWIHYLLWLVSSHTSEPATPTIFFFWLALSCFRLSVSFTSSVTKGTSHADARYGRSVMSGLLTRVLQEQRFCEKEELLFKIFYMQKNLYNTEGTEYNEKDNRSINQLANKKKIKLQLLWTFLLQISACFPPAPSIVYLSPRL